jgi:hypothetical protein
LKQIPDDHYADKTANHGWVSSNEENESIYIRYGTPD